MSDNVHVTSEKEKKDSRKVKQEDEVKPGGLQSWRSLNVNKQVFNEFAEKVKGIEEQAKEERKETLRKGIEELEAKKKDVLKASRTVAKRLSEVREQAGVSVAVGTSGVIKKSKLGSNKDFYAKLMREVLIIGQQELQDTGGVVSFEKLMEYFKKTRQNWIVNEKDVWKVLEELTAEKIIPGVQDLEDKKLIYFKPIELSNDTRKLLQTAHGGVTMLDDLRRLLGWEKERLLRAVKYLTDLGVCVREGEEVFFPGLT